MLYITENINKKEYMGRTDITELVLSPGVGEIGAWAFAYCANLQAVAIPNSLREIGQDIFKDCPRLQYITIYCGDAPDYSASETLHAPLSRLTAVAFTVFAQPALCLPAEVGTADWLTRWDEALLHYIRQADAADFSPFLAGGEEDYADALNNEEVHCRQVRLQKIRCVLARFLARDSAPMTASLAKQLREYLQDTPETLEALLYEEEHAYAYFQLYKELNLIPTDKLPDIIAILPDARVELKALFIQLLRQDSPAADTWEQFSL